MATSVDRLKELAAALEEVAAAFDWLAGLATADGDTEKAQNLTDRASSDRDDAAFLLAVAAEAPAA